MTVISGGLVSACRSRGERRKNEKESENSTQEATPVSGLSIDGHNSAAVDTLSPFHSCYHNDAELWPLLTAPLSSFEERGSSVDCVSSYEGGIAIT